MTDKLADMTPEERLRKLSDTWHPDRWGFLAALRDADRQEQHERTCRIIAEALRELAERQRKAGGDFGRQDFDFRARIADELADEICSRCEKVVWVQDEKLGNWQGCCTTPIPNDLLRELDTATSDLSAVYVNDAGEDEIDFAKQELIEAAEAIARYAREAGLEESP